ncbi:GNAT family N-acetyltransferase [Patescibacteria group bacterium]|nr:GNAT family N-acetyltransferase [Patescibacteria group bacterium]MBU2220430.1 GNAT family N-acetyltransferase [Patescibacteria group bacterium]
MHHLYKEMHPSEQETVRGMIHRFYATDPNMGFITDEKINRTFKEFSKSPEKGSIIVIKDEKQIVGYSILVNFWSNETGGNIVDIDELFVEENERGKGVGSNFIRYVIESRVNECVAVELGVIAGNDRAQKLYERMGFRLSSNRRLIYDF